MEHINECAKVFLRDQGQLFDEPVVENIGEAIEFLDEVCAVYAKNIKELREILEEVGMDAYEMSDEELEGQLEVFKLDNGGYFFVEG